MTGIERLSAIGVQDTHRHQEKPSSCDIAQSAADTAGKPNAGSGCQLAEDVFKPASICLHLQAGHKGTIINRVNHQSY